MQIELQNTLVFGISDLPSEKEFQLWLDTAFLETTHLIAPSLNHIVIRIVDKKESAELNKAFRQKEGPTNVLSFLEDPIPGFSREYLGDIVICAAVVLEEARNQHKPLKAHWAHLTIHGFLHLLGYDHNQEIDAEKMEALEIKILSKLGFNNPYESSL